MYSATSHKAKHAHSLLSYVMTHHKIRNKLVKVNN